MIQSQLVAAYHVPGPATRQIPANETRSELTAHTPARAHAGMKSQRHPCGLFWPARHPPGGDQPVGEPVPLIVAASASGNRHRRPQATGRTISAHSHSPADRACPPTPNASGRGAAHGCGSCSHGIRQRAQPRIEGVCVDGQQAATDLAHTVLAFPSTQNWRWA